MTTTSAHSISPDLHAVEAGTDAQAPQWKAAAQSAAQTAQSAAQSAAKSASHVAQSVAQSASRTAAERPEAMRLARDVAGVLVPFLLMRRLSRKGGILGLAAGLASTGALADLVSVVRRHREAGATDAWAEVPTARHGAEDPVSFSSSDLTLSEDALRADLEGPKP